LNTWITFPVFGSIFVPTNSYPETIPAGYIPGVSGLIGFPFSSTHTVTGFWATGLKICVTFP
jgi:hypothetical protein